MNTAYSMTGFATARGEGFTLMAKSVNHRFLDLQFRMPAGFEAAEMSLRQIFKTRLRRGHVDVTLTLERDDAGDNSINDARLTEVLQAFRAAASQHGLTTPPDLNAVLRLPGMLGGQRAWSEAERADLEERIAGAGIALADALNGSRSQEGTALVAELRASMQRLRVASAEVGRLRGGVRESQFERLRSRMTELLQSVGANVATLEERLLTEAALLAERSDVEEENVRLVTHVDRFVSMLDEGGELGKRLDFLLQELNREANTMLSKTGAATGENGLRITELGLGMKAEIERAREQVQNLE